VIRQSIQCQQEERGEGENINGNVGDFGGVIWEIDFVGVAVDIVMGVFDDDGPFGVEMDGWWML
jgi:hypothetical protein